MHTLDNHRVFAVISVIAAAHCKIDDIIIRNRMRSLSTNIHSLLLNSSLLLGDNGVSEAALALHWHWLGSPCLFCRLFLS